MRKQAEDETSDMIDKNLIDWPSRIASFQVLLTDFTILAVAIVSVMKRFFWVSIKSGQLCN